MKRKGLLFVATLIFSVFSLCFVACGEQPHVHDYKLEKSETMHWLKCDCGDTKDYNVHSGGTATCVAKAECATCGVVYGELGDHNYGNWVSNGDNTHTKTCSNDNNHKITENCNGSTATCTTKAVCIDCKTSYGQLEAHLVDNNSGFCLSCDNAVNPTVGILYEVSTDGNYAEVVGYNGTSTKVNIPLTYNNLPVKAICDSAFEGKNSITHIIIPDSVTSIGSGVFAGCTSLTVITIGNGVKSIGIGAFSMCTSLTSITIPDSVSSIGYIAFAMCSSLTNISVDANNLFYESIDGNLYSKGGKELVQYASGKTATSFSLLDSVTSIGDAAFGYCTTLTCITIPDGLTNIGIYAFSSCISLTKVSIPNSVTVIGQYAFEDCTSLFYNIENELKYLGNDNNPYLYLAGVTNTSITSATINENCKFIGDYAFSGCSSLTSVIIGSSVTSIGESAFSRCNSLTSVTIPDSVTSIGDYAFSGCTSLQYHIEGNLKYLGNTNNPYLYLAGVTSTSITNATINENCKFIGSSAFSSCDSLRSIEIPDNVTSIGSSAFSNCDSLTSVVIPDSVTSIGFMAFYDCESLTSIVIPDSVTNIGSYAFEYCDSLTSVTIGNSVTSIGGGAFAYCDSLISVTFRDTSTWYRTEYFMYTDDGGTEIDVTNISKNAEYFKSTDRYGWYKI